MTLLKPKRINRINNVWWINDWSSRISAKDETKKNIPSAEYPSGIVLNSKVDSLEMIKTKNFLTESLKPTNEIDGTIIIGSISPNTVPDLHELLLNIQPLGWIYISGGRKNEK